MEKQIKAALVGIGGGSKTHLTYAVVKGPQVWIAPSTCGSVKIKGSVTSRTFGLKLSDESFEYSVDAAYKNYATGETAMRVFDAELLAREDACAKCAATSQWYLNQQAN